MTTADALTLDAAQNIAFIPVVWIVWLEWGKRRHLDVAWFWLAAAFFVSWLADAATDVLPQSDQWLPSLTYPVAQTAIVAAVLVTRREAIVLVVLLVGMGIIAALAHGVQGPDVILRSFAWLTILGLAWIIEIPHRLRLCLVMYFGVGYAMWLLHAVTMSVASWYPYQLARLTGLVLFCWAASESPSRLRIVR